MDSSDSPAFLCNFRVLDSREPSIRTLHSAVYTEWGEQLPCCVFPATFSACFFTQHPASWQYMCYWNFNHWEIHGFNFWKNVICSFLADDHKKKKIHYPKPRACFQLNIFSTLSLMKVLPPHFKSPFSILSLWKTVVYLIPAVPVPSHKPTTLPGATTWSLKAESEQRASLCLLPQPNVSLNHWHTNYFFDTAILNI